MLTIALLLLTPLLVWRVYARIKVLMARQASTPARHLVGLLGFFGVAAVIGLGLPVTAEALGALVGGLGLGMGYAWFAWRGTRRESTPQGFFFTPNRRFGIALPMLLFARLLYIGVDGFMAQRSNAAMLAEVTQHPLSLALIGIVCGYFGAYSAALFVWRQKTRDEW